MSGIKWVGFRSASFITEIFAIVGLLALVGSGACDAFASSGVTVHLSNASARSNACKAIGVTHVYVTISDIKAHRSGKHMAGFVSLTSGEPEQFDLLFGLPESEEFFDAEDCPIVSMGGTGLLPGTYQQIRLLIVNNGATNGGEPIIPPDSNECSALGSTVYNCVEADGKLQPLTIPSGSETGIKIPSSQITKGGLKIAANQGVDLDVDIDACQSLVVHGGGKGHGHGKGKGGGSSTYSFKPVLHSGEVSLEPIIAGLVVAGNTSGPGERVNPGKSPVADATVWLEAAPSAVTIGNPTPTAETAQVNEVAAATSTDSDGNFAFCPVPAGKYVIVVDSAHVLPGANPSNATITTGVTVSTSGGPNNLVIPLIGGSSPAAQLDAQLTTQAASSAGAGDDIAFLAAQTMAPGTQAPIPLYEGTSGSPVTTVAHGCPLVCPIGTNCACPTIAAPPDNPVIGAAGGTYTAGSGTAHWSLTGKATQIGTSTADCSPSSMITPPMASPLAKPTLSFIACAP
jgi:hypothetical protein